MDGYESFFPPRPCTDPQPPYFLTAYEIAVKRGFRGTEEEWLTSLTAFYLAQQAGYAGTVEEWLDVLNDPVPKLQIGEVITLPGGSDATASIGGDSRNPVLNLGIPRGLGMADALPLGGGTMKGNIDMDTNRVTGLPVPVADTDAVPKSYADTKAVTAIYKGTFLAGSWGDSAPFTQEITVDGVLASDYPFVDIDLSEAADAQSVIEAWNLVGRCTVSDNNTVVGYCYEEAPEVDIPIIFKVVR